MYIHIHTHICVYNTGHTQSIHPAQALMMHVHIKGTNTYTYIHAYIQVMALSSENRISPTHINKYI